jgi:hypothetical protein
MISISEMDHDMLDLADEKLKMGLALINYINGSKETTFVGTAAYEYMLGIDPPPAPKLPDVSVLAFDVKKKDWRILRKGSIMKVVQLEEIIYNHGNR